MCLSVVAKIEKILENGEAIANLKEVRKKINISMIGEEVNEGDWVLIHTGFAISKIDQEKAQEILSAYQKTDDMDLQIY